MSFEYDKNDKESSIIFISTETNKAQGIYICILSEININKP